MFVVCGLGGGGAAAISAHRGGGESAPAGTYEAYRSALGTGAEFVEFDVRRTADGQLVSYHGARTRTGRRVGSVTYGELCKQAGHRVPLVTEIMQLLAGRAAGHLDLKETADVAAVVGQALGLLGPGGFVVTTRAAAVAAAIRGAFPEVPVALSLGGDVAERARLAWAWARSPGFTRLGGVSGCGAGWVAVHCRVADDGLLGDCRRRGIRTMVWTVNGDRELARWLAHPGVDVVVTDRPVHAAAIRGRLLAVTAAAGPPPVDPRAGTASPAP